MKRTLTLLLGALLIGWVSEGAEKAKWVSLLNGEALTRWTARDKTTWSVEDGGLVGIGGSGHIDTAISVADCEVRGIFRITEPGSKANRGFYFRVSPPTDNANGFPRGYEAQICNSGNAYPGWLWKPGKPTGKATEFLTQDGEWFRHRIRAVGEHIQFWINDKRVRTYDDAEYKSGHFAVQGHNPGMKIEAKDLYYLDLSQ